MANDYYLVYKAITAIREDFILNGESITNTEAHYLKKIIVNRKKVGSIIKASLNFATSILRSKVHLKSKFNSKKEKIFILDEDKIQ